MDNENRLRRARVLPSLLQGSVGHMGALNTPLPEPGPQLSRVTQRESNQDSESVDYVGETADNTCVIFLGFWSLNKEQNTLFLWLSRWGAMSVYGEGN